MEDKTNPTLTITLNGRQLDLIHAALLAYAAAEYHIYKAESAQEALALWKGIHAQRETNNV